MLFLTWFPRYLLPTLLACAMLPAQRTWRVDCLGGPNIDFADVPPAVAAAAPGDTVLVISRAASCVPVVRYSAPTIDKPLTLLGVFGDYPPGTTGARYIPLYGLLRVMGIPAGHRVIVSNIGLMGPPVLVNPLAPHGIHATDCAGQILLEGVRCNGIGAYGFLSRFERCQDVVVRAGYFQLSGEPLSFVDCGAVLTSTSVSWTSPFPLTQYQYTRTDYSLRLVNSRVDVIGSYIRGPSRLSTTNPLLLDHPAVGVVSGEIEVGPSSWIEGGYYNGNPIYCMSIGTLATARADTRAVLVPGYGGTPQVTWGRYDATYHDRLIGGEAYHVGVAGPANGFGLMAVGSSALVPTPLPGFGLLALDPASVLILGLQALHPTTGWAEWTSAVPANVPNDHVFAFQCATLAPNGVLGLAKPSPFTVAWPNGVSP